MEVISNWFKRYFSNPQVVILAVLLLTGFAVVMLMGNMLAPVIASVVIAYLLEGLIGVLERRRVPRLAAVLLVFLAFMAYLIFLLIGLLPLLSLQLTQLVQQLPTMVSQGQELLMHLPEKYPNFITAEQVTEMISAIRSELGQFGQLVLSRSVTSLVSIITALVYLILMPLLVFFFLKDKRRIIDWIKHYLPRERELSTRVWHDVDIQIGNYVRGKFMEILIVWAVSLVTFQVMGLNFAMLLSVLVGVSVIIPYIGAAVVTIPVAVIAYFQWGLTTDFAYLMIAYLVIQALDGNALVPLLFSEVVDLHPIAIIVAVLVFGGIWGFWGVFFAIPLATLVQAVLKAWPKGEVETSDDVEALAE
jgi:putative permease